MLTFLLVLTVDVTAADIDPAAEACIRKNAPQNAAIQNIRLRSEGIGYMAEDRVLTAKVFWKHMPDDASNVLAVFDEPDDITGTRLLFLEKTGEDEIYVYMPALFKVRRINPDRISSSMYGMDFSYEDFQWMYNMLSTAVTEQRPDAVIDGKPMYVFAVIPADTKGSLYEAILTYFNKQSCVIRKVEFFGPGSKLRKQLLTDTAGIKKVNGLLVPHKFIMRDEEEDSETELTVVNMKVDPNINDSLFDPAKLKDNRDIE
ncbi:MAG: outer membrane lipoprotein-sorting protein [Gammaproteobacteria bacterium]